MNSPITGMPGLGSSRTSTPREVFAGNVQFAQYIPAGKIIDGTASRDAGNTDDAGNSFTSVLRGGVLMGKNSTSSKYANSIIGATTAALGGGQTTLSAAAATVTELVRRQGASGTFTLTGPPTPAGVVRSRTITYSAASGTSITMTADAAGAVSNVNQINSLVTVDNTGVGTFTITVEGITTGAITYSSTAATLVTNINTALNAAFGTSAIVASGASLAALILTFSGTGYSARPVGAVTVNILVNAGGTTFTINGVGTVGTPSVSPVTTAGVTAVAADEGEFVSGSLIQPTDGTQTILTIMAEKYGHKVTDTDGASVDTLCAELTLEGCIKTANLVNYPADASLKTYVKAALNAAGQYTFDDTF